MGGDPDRGVFPVPGSQEVPCQECSGLLWLGPKQFAFYRKEKFAAVLCVQCAMPIILARAPIKSLGGESFIAKLTDGTEIKP